MRLKHSLTLCLASGAMALLSACVVVPQTSEPVVVYAPPPHQAHEEIRRCRFDNQRAHAQVLESYERARSTGRIDPAEAQQFSAMDGRLRNMHAAVYDLYNEGVRTGHIAAREAQQFRQIDERLKSYQESIRRDGVNQDECQRLSRAIALERAAVERMSR